MDLCDLEARGLRHVFDGPVRTESHALGQVGENEGGPSPWLQVRLDGIEEAGHHLATRVKDRAVEPGPGDLGDPRGVEDHPVRAGAFGEEVGLGGGEAVPQAELLRVHLGAGDGPFVEVRAHGLARPGLKEHKGEDTRAAANVEDGLAPHIQARDEVDVDTPRGREDPVAGGEAPSEPSYLDPLPGPFGGAEGALERVEGDQSVVRRGAPGELDRLPGLGGLAEREGSIRVHQDHERPEHLGGFTSRGALGAPARRQVVARGSPGGPLEAALQGPEQLPAVPVVPFPQEGVPGLKHAKGGVGGDGVVHPRELARRWGL